MGGGGPPPPPPPPGGGPPPPPPPPGFGGPPPPPPPPGGASAPKAAPADMQAELFAKIRGGVKLKKVERVERKIEKPPEKAKEDEEVEKNHLFIELLGYMETPGGNLDEFTEKAQKSTDVSREFIYRLLRQTWVEGYRVVKELSKDPKIRDSTFVFPGREWTKKIDIKDITEDILKNQFESGGIIARVHMYRFDKDSQSHLLDQIVLIKGPKFPAQPPPFTEPEPPQDNSLENRRKWEAWSLKKLEYEQGEYPQFNLLFGKLLTQDATTTAIFQQLESTIAGMRTMANSVKDTFSSFSVNELRGIVDSIPNHIKSLTKQLADTNGIIIRGEGLKLTPKFLQSLNLKSKSDPKPEAKDAAKDKDKVTSPTKTLPGLPLEELVRLLEESYIKAAPDTKRLNRLPTFAGTHRKKADFI
ncbi:hypothetical protein HDU96_006913 [Phlyctochytrium bullatum]|nr:hypothetical protein HDU96_006913 [Phlyctochytrium bullatum]